MAAALAERGGGGRPLHCAAECRQPEGAAADGVRLLVAAGADATAKSRSGWTALHWAAFRGPDDPSVAGLLMGAGCDPAAKSGGGKTALDYAKEHNKPRMAALLEAAAADPEATLAPFRAEVAALRQQGMAYVTAVARGAAAAASVPAGGGGLAEGVPPETEPEPEPELVSVRNPHPIPNETDLLCLLPSKPSPHNNIDKRCLSVLVRRRRSWRRWSGSRPPSSSSSTNCHSASRPNRPR
eukprot:COSAG04_NODE_493_length_13427_cov_20.233118_8_plen_240_part_00